MAVPASSDMPPSTGEFEPGLVGAAAPVRDFRGRIVAAINVSGPKFRLGDRLEPAGEEVRQGRPGVVAAGWRIEKEKEDMAELLERLERGPVICAEGYLFELERRGYLQAGGFVPEVVLEHPEKVAELHREFVHAGSDVVEAFTYYAHREKLRLIGQARSCSSSINRQALAIAGEVAAESGALLGRQRLQHQRLRRRGVPRRRSARCSRSRSAGRPRQASTS